MSNYEVLREFFASKNLKLPAESYYTSGKQHVCKVSNGTWIFKLDKKTNRIGWEVKLK